jgi:predicted DNA-binding transcriptional regulator YafY
MPKSVKKQSPEDLDQSKSLEPLLFSLEVLKRIPRAGRGKVSSGDLLNKLGSHLFEDGATEESKLRKIQRHLASLRRVFTDIERDNGKPIGYRWRNGSSGFSISTLTEQESLLLALTQAHLGKLAPVSVMNSLSGFFEQARLQLKDPDHRAQTQAAREWLGKVRVIPTSQPLLAPQLVEGVFETVSEALYENRLLEIEYRGAGDGVLRHTVMPLGLAQQGVRFYLVCRFQPKKGEFKGNEQDRVLVLHRILSASAGKRTFDPPADFDLEKFNYQGSFGLGKGKQIKIRFRVNKKIGAFITEMKLSADQHEQTIGDDYEISATVVESELLKNWLRGFGRDVQVLEPPGFLDQPER